MSTIDGQPSMESALALPAGESALATRVMSPNRGQIVNYSFDHFDCEVCFQAVDGGVFLCAQCCKAGHWECLGLQSWAKLPQYAFCPDCMPWVIKQQSRLQTQADQQRWSLRIAAAMAAWRETAVGASGMLGSLGVALGGAGATLVHGTAALAAGTLQGARAGGTLTPQLAMTDAPPPEGGDALAVTGPPVPPPPDDPPGDARAWGPLRGGRRSRSLGSSVPSCVACWTANRGHKAHTNEGDCIRNPGCAVFGAPPGGGVLPPPIPDRVAAADPPGEELVGEGPGSCFQSVAGDPASEAEAIEKGVSRGAPESPEDGKSSEEPRPDDYSALSLLHRLDRRLTTIAEKVEVACSSIAALEQKHGDLTASVDALGTRVGQLEQEYQQWEYDTKREETAGPRGAFRSLEDELEGVFLECQPLSDNGDRKGKPAEYFIGSPGLTPRAADGTVASGRMVLPGEAPLPVQAGSIPSGPVREDALNFPVATVTDLICLEPTAGKAAEIVSGVDVEKAQRDYQEQLVNYHVPSTMRGTGQSSALPATETRMPRIAPTTSSSRGPSAAALVDTAQPGLIVGAGSRTPGFGPMAGSTGAAGSPGFHTEGVAASMPAGSALLQEELPAGEVSLLIKFLQSMGDLPTYSLGDPSTRGERLLLWKVGVETVLRTTRRVVIEWWDAAYNKAEVSYKKWLQSPVLEREHIRATMVPVPPRWETVEDWFYPKFLEKMPPKIKEAAAQACIYGGRRTVSDLIFELLKLVQAGGLDDQDHVLRALVSPNPCKEPAAALKELRRWYNAFQRALDMGVTLPHLDQLYRGARSIYSAAFETDDFHLRLRWTTMESQWGYPHQLTHAGLKAINQFAEAELSAMVVAGRSAQNPSLPLTQTQRDRERGEHQAEKKRAAAARNSAAGVLATAPSTAPKAAAVDVNGRRISSTTSSWAKPCTSWSANGSCARGISCWFRHDGIPLYDGDVLVNRCITCGKPGHVTKDCRAPGGGADPKREEVWKAYRERREAAAKANEEKGAGGKETQPKGKGYGGRGQGKAKGKAQGKVNIADAATVELSEAPAASPSTARMASATAAAVNNSRSFPAGAAGLDSWANVYLTHVPADDSTGKWNECLRLANGDQTPCQTLRGEKGIPMARVAKGANSVADHIDLLPMTWLIDRGCDCSLGGEITLTTPLGRVLKLEKWDNLPFLTAEQIRIVFEDLPLATKRGRNGQTACEGITAASVTLGPPPRVCGARVDLKASLQHLEGGIDKSHRKKLLRKYRAIPDIYYGEAESIGPEHIASIPIMTELGHGAGKPVKLWEWMAGSGTLSDRARARKVSHLPPVDFRWGFHVGRLSDQVQLLYALLVFGTSWLFASPDCSPWGIQSRAWTPKKREAERGQQVLTLRFLAVACLVQVVLGRSYLIEQPRDSEMMIQSAMAELKGHSLPHHRTVLDQCQYGAVVDAMPIKKATEINSNVDVTEMSVGLGRKCPREHVHNHLQGLAKDGLSKTAHAAVYPVELCDKFLDLVTEKTAVATPSGGRKGHLQLKNFDFQSAVTDVVINVMTEIRDYAYKRGYEHAWKAIVFPWARGYPQMDALANDVAKVPKHLMVFTAAAGTASGSDAAVNGGDGTSVHVEADSDARVGKSQDDEDLHDEPQALEDLVTSKMDTDPWQYKAFSNTSATWQAAAQRRHSHWRRSNSVIGVAAVDLSGPHEATPVVGAKVGQRPAHYFLAVTVDPSQGAHDQGVQTDFGDQAVATLDGGPPRRAEAADLEGAVRKPPLIYASLLATKSEASAAVMTVLARIRDDHGHLPGEVVFRLHSDKGSEFLTDQLEQYCQRHGIRRTTTQGYDPSANGGGENAVGFLKRKARQLLTGSRLPTCWWGTAVMAAAHISRCAAGLYAWPSIPYGTRCMVVRDPPPRNAFLPRSMPATVLGTSERVPGGLVVFQDGRLREVVNVQASQLQAEELNWVKAHLRDWDHPISPCDPPGGEGWDPRAVEPHPAAALRKGAQPDGDALFPPIVEELPTEAANPEEKPEDPKIRPEELIDQMPETKGLADAGEAILVQKFDTAASTRVTTSLPSSVLDPTGRMCILPHACGLLGAPGADDESTTVDDDADIETDFDTDEFVQKPASVPEDRYRSSACMASSITEPMGRQKIEEDANQATGLNQPDAVVAFAADDVNSSEPPVDLPIDPGSKLVPESEVKKSDGPELAKWKLAAEAELQNSFRDTGAITRTTPEELRRFGGLRKVLPMKCV